MNFQSSDLFNNHNKNDYLLFRIQYNKRKHHLLLYTYSLPYSFLLINILTYFDLTSKAGPQAN